MRKLLTLAFVLCGVLQAQTIWLSTPGSGNGFCSITAATNATPIRVTVDSLSNCGITTNGQNIRVVEVGGNTAANIHLENSTDTKNLIRMVANINVGTNQFDLQDGTGASVAGNGAYTNGGRVSLATQYNLKSGGIVYLDGTGGPITASLTNTSSTGRADPAGLVSGPFLTYMSSGDGAAWPSNWGDARDGYRAANWAMHYAMTGSTTSRDKALAALRNPDQMLPTVACREDLPFNRQCQNSGSSYADYPSQFLVRWAQAYSIMRGLLTAPERANFMAYMYQDIPWTQGGIDYTGAAWTKPVWKVLGTNGTISISGTAVTGTGTSFLSDVAVGDIISEYAAQYGEGYQVAAVNSDTSITLAQAGATITNRPYLVGAKWTSSQVGMQWQQNHFDTAVDCGGAYGLYETYTRDCSAGYGELAGYARTPLQNLSLARMEGLYAMGLASCIDDNRGCLRASRIEEYLTNMTMPRAQALYTGFSVSSAGYHVGRQYNIPISMTIMTKNSTVEGLDLMAGLKMPLNGMRWAVSGPLVVPDIHMPSSEGDPNGITNDKFFLPLLGMFYAPSSTEARYIRWWELNAPINYGTTGFLSYDQGRNWWWHLLFNDPTVTALQPPTTFHFDNIFDRAACVVRYGSAKCQNTNGRAFSISFSDWSFSTRTYAGYNHAVAHCLDHCQPPLDAPGWPLVAKGGKLLITNDVSNGGLLGNRDQRGYIEIGGTAGNLYEYTGYGNATRYWTAGDAAYSVTNVDLAPAYIASANVTMANRQLIHFKAGGAEYIIEPTKITTSAGTSIKMYQHNHLNACGTPTSATCISATLGTSPQVVGTFTSPNTRIITKPIALTGAILGTTATGSATNGSYTGGANNTFRWHVCPTSDNTTCNASATSAEFAMVHKISTNTSDTMPAFALSTAGSFRVLEIQDPTSPKIAAFTFGGSTASSASFTTTHAGTGQYVVSGLAAATYKVQRNGVDVSGCTALNVVAGENTLTCDILSGTITMTQIGVALDITTTDPMPEGTVGSSYSQALTIVGGTSPYTCSVQSGSLPAGLSLTGTGSCTISGTPTTAASYSFTIRATDNAAATNDQVLSIVINAAAAPRTTSNRLRLSGGAKIQ